ncbi:MAG: thiamine-phosphate kinase [Pseudomonadota bacterium]
MQETDWIQRYIAPLVTAAGADCLRDDVALLSTGAPTIVTMDTLVEGIHFLATDPNDTVGQKLIRVNVSDIFAKGAVPQDALLSIAWPKGRSETRFASVLQGLARDLEAFQIALIGGDLVATDGPLTLTLTLTGQCLNAAPVRRSGGRPGQRLLISGEIGWGGLGLQAARSGKTSPAAQRYRVPEIATESAARTVARVAAASMDVSDGLLIDVKRLAEASGCGAALALEQVPLAQPTDHAEGLLNQCTSGDDYCVLIAVEGEQIVPGFVEIGTLTQIPGLQLTLRGQRVNPPSTLGFEH